MYGSNESPSDYAERIVTESLQEFAQMQLWRNVTAQQWEEIAQLIDPPSRNTFYYGSWNFPGMKKTDRQVDTTGTLALSRFVAILDSLLTPRNMMWHSLQSSNEYLMRRREVKIWFEQVNNLLFKYRYHPTANFSSQNCNHWRNLGAYGSGSLMIDKYEGVDGFVGLRYFEVPLGEMYWRENHQKQVDGFIRHFRLTAMQAIKQFGAENVSEYILKKAEAKDQYPLEFIHRVCPRDDYDPHRLDYKGMLYGSYYISLIDKKLLREGGYSSLPIAASRYEQTANETYGRSPAMLVLPTLKTINSIKKDYLTQAHRAGEGVYLTTDDGVVDFTVRPGSLNKGGLDGEGNELVKILPTGEIQITKEMMQGEAAIVDAAFLVDLFKILLGDPKIFTATQIVEMMSQRGILIAPTVGRQQSEYLGNMVPRELDVLAQAHVLPELPPVMREAIGEYHITYASPLVRDMKAQEIAGFQRTVEMATTISQATGDPSIMDVFDFPTSLKAIADQQFVPETWMSSPARLAALGQKRLRAQQVAEQNQTAPGMAALLKARAAQAKAGMTPEEVGQQPQGR